MPFPYTFPIKFDLEDEPIWHALLIFMANERMYSWEAQLRDSWSWSARERRYHFAAMPRKDSRG